MALSMRRSVSWSLVGRVVYAGSQWLMLLVLARMGGLEAVGRFALALAVTGPVVLFSNLGLRHVQATDAERSYDHLDYLAVRAWTTVAALAVLAGVVLLADYPAPTAQVIALVALAKGFESMSDVVHGLQQVHHRLDLTTRSLALRGLAGVAAMALAYPFGGLTGAVAGMTCAWGAVYLVHDLGSQRRLLAGADATAPPRTTPARARRLHLAWVALPMGVVALLISLNVNVPRYFIEAWLGEQTLGAFAAMFYFVVVGSLVVNGLGQATLVALAAHHASGRRPAFFRLLGRLLAASVVLGGLGVAVSWLFGAPLLTLLYGPAFARDADLFVWIMLAGALNYAASALFYGVTARRIFAGQALLYAVVTAVNAGACALLIGAHGVYGVIWAWIAALGVQIVLSALLIARAAPTDAAASS
jgi:O-antigen/teichoic acid export membrane protein